METEWRMQKAIEVIASVRCGVGMAFAILAVTHCVTWFVNAQGKIPSELVSVLFGMLGVIVMCETANFLLKEAIKEGAKRRVRLARKRKED